MMEPADRPMTFGEREALFDTLDAFLARQLPVCKPDEPSHHADDCPQCGRLGERSRRHYRYGPGVTNWCPQCAWQEPGV